MNNYVIVILHSFWSYSLQICNLVLTTYSENFLTIFNSNISQLQCILVNIPLHINLGW